MTGMGFSLRCIIGGAGVTLVGVMLLSVAFSGDGLTSDEYRLIVCSAIVALLGGPALCGYGICRFRHGVTPEPSDAPDVLAEDVPPSSSRSSRIVTGGVVVLVVLAAAVKLMLKVGQFHDATNVASTPQGTTDGADVDIYAWVSKREKFDRFLATQREQRQLSDADLDAVLRSVWTETHPGQSPPWMVIVGDDPYWWWTMQDWDLALIAIRLEARPRQDQATDPPVPDDAGDLRSGLLAPDES